MVDKPDIWLNEWLQLDCGRTWEKLLEPAALKNEDFLFKLLVMAFPSILFAGHTSHEHKIWLTPLQTGKLLQPSHQPPNIQHHEYYTRYLEVRQVHILRKTISESQTYCVSTYRPWHHQAITHIVHNSHLIIRISDQLWMNQLKKL